MSLINGVNDLPKGGVLEYQFNGVIREMFMTHDTSVYYKDKKNVLRFA
jgi:hypothetical protein